MYYSNKSFAANDPDCGIFYTVKWHLALSDG